MTGAVAEGTTGMLDEWEITELKDIVEINPESRDPTQNPDEKFSYIDIDSVENGSGVINSVKDLLGKDAPSRARRVVRTDDVIMSEVRPYLKAFALVPKKLNNQICSTGFAVLRSKGAVDPKYLLNTLFSDAVIEQCNRMMVGAQYPALNDSQVKKIQIPLPPLPEQRRIAAILTTVDDAIQRSQQAIAETERLKAGVMQELMTKGIGHKEFREDPDVGKVSKEWEVTELKNVMDQRSEIIQPSPKLKEKFVGLEHIETGESTLKKYDLNADLKSTKSRFYRGDILYGKLRPYLDKAAISNFEGICSTDLLVLTPRQDKSLATFLINILHSHVFIQYAISTTSGTNHPRTSWKAISEFRIGLPSLIEQQKIATVITSIDRKLDLQRKRKSLLEQLKQGLMNDLLTGRRRVKVT